MPRLILGLLFGGRWYLQLILALITFGIAAGLYTVGLNREADKALALKQGVPPAVSLNVFDPGKDIHAADEVHVIGWANVDYNYELTKNRRKRSDIVRRMFVLLGPEDAPDSRAVRAVVLMPPESVEGFIESVVANYRGDHLGNPVFAVNGTSKASATLDDMADDALKEKGLTKAPGFRYIELWDGGREAALKPFPTGPAIFAAIPGGIGILLLLLAAIKFLARGTSLAPPRPASAAAAPAAVQDQQIQQPRSPEAEAFANFASGQHSAAASRPSEGEIRLRGLLREQSRDLPTYALYTPPPPEGMAPAPATSGPARSAEDAFAAFATAPGTQGPGATGPDPTREAAFRDSLRRAEQGRLAAAGKPFSVFQFVRRAYRVAIIALALLIFFVQAMLSGMIPGSVFGPSTPIETGAPAPATAPATAASAPAPVVSAEAPPSKPAPPQGQGGAAPSLIPEAARLGGKDSAVPPPPEVAAGVAPLPATEKPVVAAATPAATQPAAAPVASEIPAPASLPLMAGLAMPSTGVLGGVGLAIALLLALIFGRGLLGRSPTALSGRDPWEKLAREVRATA